MSDDYGLTEADKADLHARLASWFGDDRQAFLVSHLAPVVDRIKAEACAQVAAEFQWNALEMARRADLAERRAEDAEAEVERLRSTLVEVRQVFDLQCPPMLPDKYVDHGAWVAHSWWNTVLGNVLKRADLIDALRPPEVPEVRVGFRYQDGEVFTPEREVLSDDDELPTVVLDRGDGEWLTLEELRFPPAGGGDRG